MTERSGGSDISGTETIAYPAPDNTYIIKGFKWFSSATDSDITLLLAKTPNSNKVSLFWARVKYDDGTLNGVRIIRLKDKFGTKPIPTAELELVGMQGAVMIGTEGEGVKAISEVLNITRVHCAMGCVTNMKRGFEIVKVPYSRCISNVGLLDETEGIRSIIMRDTTPSQDDGTISCPITLYDSSILLRNQSPRANRSYRRKSRCETPPSSFHTSVESHCR